MKSEAISKSSEQRFRGWLLCKGSAWKWDGVVLVMSHLYRNMAQRYRNNRTNNSRRATLKWRG